MKKSRKLIPALVMLLVSAVMMSTASYAWFSMNNQVTADGMSVKATTPASLEITADAADDSSWAYEATVSNNATNLNPIHADGNKWYVPTAANTIKVDGSPTVPFDSSNTTYWKEVTIDTTTGKEVGNTGNELTYALVQKFYLRTNVGTADAGTSFVFGAQATVAEGSKLVGGVKVYIMDKAGTLTDITGAKAGAWTAPLSSSDDKYVELTVIVVYDGTINTAINNNNADLVATSVSVVFAQNTPTP